jgi:hypothetical protein
MAQFALDFPDHAVAVVVLQIVARPIWRASSAEAICALTPITRREARSRLAVSAIASKGFGCDGDFRIRRRRGQPAIL